MPKCTVKSVNAVKRRASVELQYKINDIETLQSMARHSGEPSIVNSPKFGMSACGVQWEFSVEISFSVRLDGRCDVDGKLHVLNDLNAMPDVVLKVQTFVNKFTLRSHYQKEGFKPTRSTDILKYPNVKGDNMRMTVVVEICDPPANSSE